MTSFPAAKLELTDRELIAEGMWVDITIFNPQQVRDRATYFDSHRYPDGIEYVLVNGIVVLTQGENRGRLAGCILTHN